MKKRVFISYKRVDQIAVFDLLKSIESIIKEKCWIDQTGIPSDARWDKEIRAAIDDCEVFVFACSKEHTKIRSLEDDWTYKEINYAFEKGKHIEVVKIDNALLPEWLIKYLPIIDPIRMDDSAGIQVLYENLFKWLGIVDERKKNVLPDGLFKVGELFYRAMDDGLTVEVASPCKTFTEKSPYDSFVINIPNFIIYDGYEYEVVRIGEHAFSNSSNLKSVIIPNSLKSIGKHAFHKCTNLWELELPDTISNVECFAFESCSAMKCTNIPSSLTTICHGVFFDCSSLTSLNLPDGVTEIEADAFAYCSSLKSISIPENVSRIGRSAFRACSSLESITLPDSLTIIEQELFEDCSRLLSVIIPDSVKVIEDSAFSGCSSLTSISIPSGVESISCNVFSGCSSLNNIVVEKGNLKYDSHDDCNAIIDTQAKALVSGCYGTVIPKGITTICSGAFKGIPIEFIDIPEGVVTIESWGFYMCKNLLVVTLPKGLKQIDAGAFNLCKSLQCINIPRGTKEKYLMMEGLHNMKDKLVEY